MIRMTRVNFLDAAHRAVVKDRAATHGNPDKSFAQLAAIWGVRLGVDITPAQVAILLVDLKTVRAWTNPGHADSWVDIAGYAALGGELATIRAPRVDAPGPLPDSDGCRRVDTPRGERS